MNARWRNLLLAAVAALAVPALAACAPQADATMDDATMDDPVVGDATTGDPVVEDAAPADATAGGETPVEQAGVEVDFEDEVTPEEFATLQTATYEIYPTEGSQANGTVQVTEDPDGRARVAVVVRGLQDGVTYPSHLHQGDCGSGGSIVYPLEQVPGSADSNVSEIDATVLDVINSDLHINVHAPDDLSNILACGEVGLGANAQWR